MTDWLIDFNIPIILWVQGWGSWLETPMQFFSFLGTEQFFLIVIPAIFWCWDTRLGLRLGIYLFASVAANTFLKLAVHGPRPYWVDTRVHAYAAESSFGPPSNHAQTAVVIWGTLAAGLARRWAWGIALALMFFIGLSRVYLGVHFPTDVLFGWLVGAVLIAGMLKVEPAVITWLRKHSLSVQLLIALAASLLLLIVGALPRLFLGSWEVPAAWIENALKAFPGEPIDPFALSGLVTATAAFFGLAAGAIWVRARGGYSTQGSPIQLLLRYLIGLVGVLALWFGLGQIFPDGEDFLSLLLRYLRYALVGCWVSGFAPELFIRLHLAKRA